MREHLQHLFTGWVDILYRRLHGKDYLPSWSLRATVGFPADFEITGAEFVAYLKLLCGLKSQHSALDIGCGCGMMALQLESYLAGEGRYVGMDVDRAAIAWCQTHITARNPRFVFYHVDLKNTRYNPSGALSDASFRFSEPDASFEVVLLKSVFTHMRPDGVQNYLNEIARLLKPGGRCLASFFLLNDRGSTGARPGSSKLSFDHGDDDCRYVDPAMPEKAIAYREGYVLEMLKRSGLALVAPPYYGTWSGRPDGLSFQDLLLIARE